MDQQTLYGLVLKYFKDSLGNPKQSIQILGVIRGVDDEAKRLEGKDPNSITGYQLSTQEHETINEIIWDLIIQRVIGIPSNGLPFLHVTEYGKKVLSSFGPVPYDRDGYLKNIYSKNPSLDELVKSYLEESLICLRGGAYRAGVVMLGVASERLFNLLVESFQKKYKFKTVLYDPLKYKPLKQLKEKFLKQFQPRKNDLSKELQEDLEVVMDSIFLLIKNARNDSGHPTGIHITREQMFSYLSVFPVYCERMCKIINFYA